MSDNKTPNPFDQFDTPHQQEQISTKYFSPNWEAHAVSFIETGIVGLIFVIITIAVFVWRKWKDTIRMMIVDNYKAIILIGIILIIGYFIIDSLFSYSVNDCVLDKMPGTTSDLAAKAILNACRGGFKD